MHTWQLQEAKARMSELVKRAQEAPQHITVHGKPVAVMVSQDAFVSLSAAHGSLVDFMRASPLAELTGAGAPAFARNRSRTRPAPKL